MITNIQPVPQIAVPFAMKTDSTEFKPLTPAALNELRAEPFVPSQYRYSQQQVIAAFKKVEPEGSKLSKLLETISDEVVEITKVSNEIIKKKVVTQALLKNFLDLIQLPKNPSTIFSCNKSLLARELGQQKPLSELDTKLYKGKSGNYKNKGGLNAQHSYNKGYQQNKDQRGGYSRGATREGMGSVMG